MSYKLIGLLTPFLHVLWSFYFTYSKKGSAGFILKTPSHFTDLQCSSECIFQNLLATSPWNQHKREWKTIHSYDLAIYNCCLLHYNGDSWSNVESIFWSVCFLNTLVNKAFEQVKTLCGATQWGERKESKLSVNSTITYLCLEIVAVRFGLNGHNWREK